MRTNVVYQGDCIQGLKLLPDKSVDCIITDPPYNLGKAEWDKNILDLLDSCAKECSRLLKDSGLMLWFVPTRYSMIINNIIEKYIPYKWTFVWVSPNKMSPADIGFSKMTLVFIYSKSKIFKNMPDIKILNWSPTFNLKEGHHPTPKPIQLINYIVKNVSNESDIVLDPFMGSGTTALACKQLNRRWVGFEISPEYCKIIKKRLSQKVMTGFFETSLNSDLTGSENEPQILPLAELR